MLIDWFTVGAQALNFLILVWLMKRFLYKPILDAIDAREKRIAAELADAAAKKAEAQKERDEFQHKNEEFDQQRAALLSKATDEAKAERQRLLDEARKAADALSAKRQETLKNDAQHLNQAISRRTQQEVFAIARKALTDLATTSLEERLGEVFTRRLREMDGQAKAGLAEALKTASGPGAGAQRVRPAGGAARGDPECAQRNLLGRSPRPVRDRAGPGQRDRTHREWPESGMEHRGLPASLEKGVGELLKTSLPRRSHEMSSATRKADGSASPMNDRAAEELQRVFDRAFAAIGQAREAFTPQLTPREVGTITSVSTGIARVSGPPGVGFEELVQFPGGVFGIAFNVDEDEIGVVLLGEYSHLHAGDEVERTGRVMDVAVGDGLLGRVIDPLGRPLDGKGPVVRARACPSSARPPPIMDRAPSPCRCRPGSRSIDALIPIGRGQRELILGDRQTGKTAIAIDTILNQRGKNVLCVYCAIGQRASAVAKVVASLREKGAMDYTVVVVTEGNDPPGLAYIAPYAATSIAEHFMEAGRDVLIVYDDLTQHARAYRELSLLLRRPPGREAFPGDIFYIHSRLLERATHLRKERGGGSLTALPIIETEAQDISAYIPTNLISITDGQIYLSPSLFELGVLPAVDVGKSVSRVGGKAQRAAYRAVAGDLKLAYAQFEELETFARFGARLDDGSRKTIEHGRRIRACLKQPEFAPVSVPAQISVLLALTEGLFDSVPFDHMADAEQALHEAAAKIPAEVGARFESAKELSGDDRKSILEIARKALASFVPKPAPASGSKPEAGSAPKDDSKPEAESKAKDASKPETGSAPKDDSKPEAESKAKDASKPEAGSKPTDDSKPEAKSKVKDASKPEAGSKPTDDSKPEAESKAKDASKPEAGSKPTDDSKPEAAPEKGA